jgi:hypothetical protein
MLHCGYTVGPLHFHVPLISTVYLSLYIKMAMWHAIPMLLAFAVSAFAHRASLPSLNGLNKRLAIPQTCSFYAVPGVGACKAAAQQCGWSDSTVLCYQISYDYFQCYDPAQGFTCCADESMQRLVHTIRIEFVTDNVNSCRKSRRVLQRRCDCIWNLAVHELCGIRRAVFWRLRTFEQFQSVGQFLLVVRVESIFILSHPREVVARAWSG